jgi:hypothetical protein
MNVRVIWLLTGLLAMSVGLGRTIAQEFARSQDVEPRYWATSEYLMGWIKDGPNPVPLIARGSLSDPLPSALGQPGTEILAGGDQVDYGLLHGGRVSVGKWIDPCQTFGLEAEGFLMGKSSPASSFSSISSDTTSLSVPIQLTDGTETSIFALVNTPGTSLPDEQLAVEYSSQFWGAQGNLIFNQQRTCNWNVDGLLGFKHLNLNEALDLTADIQRDVTGGRSVVLGHDHFGTRSEFYGSTIGVRGIRSGRRLQVSTSGVIGLGFNANEVNVSGSRLQESPSGLVTVTPGFVFAEPTNQGTFQHRNFSVVPECKLGLSYWLRRRLAVDVSYSALYWNNVVRPGDQIDRVVNPTQRGGGTLVGDARPSPLFHRTDLWFHAVGFGVTYRF